jgi:N-acetylneuraminate synthase/sialic acid synthase
VRSFTINGHTIRDFSPCYVIAEIGSNHGGDVTTALDLINAAARAGVDAVKFQKRHNETLYSPMLLQQPYTGDHSYGATYGAHRAALELDGEAFTRISAQAHLRQVTWFATAFDEHSADFLMAQNVPAFKIASGGLTDVALLTHIAHFRKPMIVSTGGGTWKDVDAAVERLSVLGAHFALLHCTAAYPAEFRDLNLQCIGRMRERYPDIIIGWSCHVHNLSMAMQAHAYGARMLEVHVTLNRAMKGTDQAFSLEPSTLTKLCKDLKRAHLAAGDGEKCFYASERGPIAKMRRVRTADGLQITGGLANADDSALGAA